MGSLISKGISPLFRSGSDSKKDEETKSDVDPTNKTKNKNLNELREETKVDGQTKPEVDIPVEDPLSHKTSSLKENYDERQPENFTNNEKISSLKEDEIKHPSDQTAVSDKVSPENYQQTGDTENKNENYPKTSNNIPLARKSFGIISDSNESKKIYEENSNKQEMKSLGSIYPSETNEREELQHWKFQHRYFINHQGSHQPVSKDAKIGHLQSQNKPPSYEIPSVDRHPLKGVVSRNGNKDSPESYPVHLTYRDYIFDRQFREKEVSQVNLIPEEDLLKDLRMFQEQDPIVESYPKTKIRT